jgi:hypothetical protein
MVKKCKILYILSCFPWRFVRSVKGGIWRLLCFAFCICIALLRHCFAFAFALQTSRLTRGSKKYWGGLPHRTTRSLLSPQKGKGNAVQSVGITVFDVYLG